MKMKKTGMGLLIPKKLRIGGMTFYQRGGQVIGRVSESMEKRSNTLPQFIQRQKMRHTTALWKMLRFCELRFTERANAYQVVFRSYTGAFVNFYVDKTSGTTRMEEYVPTLDVKSDAGKINLFDYLDKNE